MQKLGRSSEYFLKISKLPNHPIPKVSMLYHFCYFLGNNTDINKIRAIILIRFLKSKRRHEKFSKKSIFFRVFTPRLKINADVSKISADKANYFCDNFSPIPTLDLQIRPQNWDHPSKKSDFLVKSL